MLKSGLFSIAVLVVFIQLQAQQSYSTPFDTLRGDSLKEVVIVDSQQKGEVSEQRDFFQNPEELVATLNGFDLIRRGAYASELSYRGLVTGQYNLTVDGMKIFGACTDKMDPITSYVEVNNLSAIHAGNMQSQYGGAMGAGVNLVTKKPQLNEAGGFVGDLGLGLQSNGLGRQALADLSYSDTKWAIRWSGNYRNAQDYTDGSGNDIDYTQFNKINSLIQLKVALSEIEFLEFMYLYDDAWDVGYAALPMDVSKARTHMYSVTYKRFSNADRGWDLEWKVYGNNIFHEMDDTQREDVFMHMDMPGWSDTFGSYLTLRSKRNAMHQITTTVDAFVNRSFAEMVMYPSESIPMYMQTWPDVSRRNVGWYVQDEINLNESNRFILSSRIDFSANHVLDSFGIKQGDVFHLNLGEARTTLYGNLNAKWMKSLDNNMIIEGMLGLNQRQATISEQYAFYIYNANDNYDYLGDPDLKNETEFKIEAGLSKQHVLFAWAVNGFYWHINNYILGEVDDDLYTMTYGADGVKWYRNFPYAQFVGGEAQWSVRPVSSLEVTNKTSYTWAQDAYGVALPFIPPLKNAFHVNYSRNLWRFGLRIVSASAQNRARESFGETATAGYTLLDLDANVKLGKRTRLSAGINNLFNESYQDHLSWGNLQQAGRNMWLNCMFSL